MAVAHYLEALDFQKEIVKSTRSSAARTRIPHPKLACRRRSLSYQCRWSVGVGAINMERLNHVTRSIDS